MSHDSASDALSPLIGEELVLDLASPFVILGKLEAVDPLYVVLRDADVHDLRDSKTTRELYVLQARQHGVRCNRVRVCVRREEIVSFSRLAEVVE